MQNSINVKYWNFNFLFSNSNVTFAALNCLNEGEVPEWPKGTVC
jgi:hypothetical protein